MVYPPSLLTYLAGCFITSKQTRPAPWHEAETKTLRKIRGVCLDIDETLSTDGKLTSEAFNALWSLHDAGFQVVPITGRPAGWCDLIARFWPVHAVVGENGAFSFFVKNKIRTRMETLEGEDLEDLHIRLKKLHHKILQNFPHAKTASDQAYRDYDLAIDTSEDVPAWPKKDVKKLISLCHDAGAHAKLSSIHVNIWFGSYDKVQGFRKWLKAGSPGATKKITENQWLFIGDSPNDEPMFKTFKYSVGVANLKVYLSEMQHAPTWITKNKSGAGFSEMAKKLISATSKI